MKLEARMKYAALISHRFRRGSTSELEYSNLSLTFQFSDRNLATFRKFVCCSYTILEIVQYLSNLPRREVTTRLEHIYTALLYVTCTPMFLFLVKK